MNSKNLLTSKLFDETYHHTFNYISDYLAEVILKVLKDQSIVFDTGITMNEIFTKLTCTEEYKENVRWVIHYLIQQKKINEIDGVFFKENFTYKLYDESQLTTENIQPSMDVIRKIGENWPSIISGEKNPLKLLFGANETILWEKYFSNQHYLYSIHNYWAANKLAGLVSGKNKKILELGAGYGSGSEALLDALTSQHKEIESYTLSDISPLLVRKLKKNLELKYDTTRFEAIGLNIDQIKQNEEVKFDYIYAVNVIHCAKDPVQTISNLIQKMNKGGTMVISECTRGHYQELLHQEFIFSLLPGFEKINNERDYPNFGFLTPRAWIDILHETGVNDWCLEINPGPKCLGALMTIRI
ncbi:class I SAM-dependent methyltransferase [Cytobacillus pseudoceanisediminis]|uniref:class I SAM-dependent methyltransferase n=1 Tax=Cytobacillus pseudoceanisediminis TaxID=3051614 RepID=UPI003C2BDDB9